MRSDNFIKIHCEVYDKICKEMSASAWEVDDKFGLFFKKTIGLYYLFELKDKNKFLWAKLTYNI